jgi:hypothetical protein
MIPSAAQTSIIESIKNNKNIIVDAVAGGGKTTTVLHIARSFPDKKIIQITYNSSLKIEVREKVISQDIQNLLVHTYHSIAVNYYDKHAYTDINLHNIISTNSKPFIELPQCDILVIDETQDQTMLYFNLVKKFMADLRVKNIIDPLLIVLGDKQQGIYTFKGADTRFLTMAENVWKRKFENVSMNISYRVTNNIATFINRYLIGEERIISNKQGPKVEYIKYDIWQVHNILIPEILQLIKTGAVTPGDIFVLAGSVRSAKTPIRRLENALVMHGIKCFIPLGDSSNLDADIIKEKVIFSSLHQSKGRERKMVIIYGFDENYFEFYAKDMDRSVCPPTIYVAASRALERLYIIEGERQAPMPFLKAPITGSNEIINFRQELPLLKRAPIMPEQPFRKMTPSELVRFLNETTIIKLSPIVRNLFKEIIPAGEGVDIPSKVSNNDGTFEEVSEINSLTIQTMFESKHSDGKNTIIQEYLKNVKLHPVEQLFLVNAMSKVPKKCEQISDWLYICNLYYATIEGIFFKIAQITDYSWLPIEKVEACHRTMSMYLPNNLEYERVIAEKHIYNSSKFGEIHFYARVDALNNSAVWEFKCVDQLQLEHYLQVIVYAWLWHNAMEEKVGTRKFKIMNIRNGHLKELILNWDVINNVIDILLENAFVKAKSLSDNDFLSMF